MGGPLQPTDLFLPLGVTRRAISVGKDLIAPDGPPAPAPVDAPPPSPDLTDEVVAKARAAARRRLLTGSGASQSFLTGPLGVTK